MKREAIPKGRDLDEANRMIAVLCRDLEDARKRGNIFLAAALWCLGVLVFVAVM